MTMADVLIAGGGLTGSALAIQFGRMGFSVELFERGTFPREKPCGEGLMPAGAAALDRLGLHGMPAGAPFSGIRYHLSGEVIHGRFPRVHGLPVTGRGYRRRDLDLALFSAAMGTPGVAAQAGTRVDAPLVEHGRVTGLIVEGETRRGRLVVAADGSQSRLRHALRLNEPEPRKRVGMRAHFQVAAGQPPVECVDIFLQRGHEIYVTPLRDGEFLVAVLAGAESLEGPVESRFHRWLAGQSILAGRLRDAVQTSELLVAAPLSGRARRRTIPGLVLLGDAAGFTDPITGGGMAQALLAAELLAQFAARGLDTADQWLADFDRAREALLRDYRLLTRGVLWLADHQTLFRMVLRTGRMWPRLLTHFLGVSGGVFRLWGGTTEWGTALQRCGA